MITPIEINNAYGSKDIFDLSEFDMLVDESKKRLIEDIRLKVNKALLQVPLANVLLSKFGGKDMVEKYIPEILCILLTNQRGLEILKETKIYDFIISN